MFSVIFPGQGSQIVSMGKDLYDKYDLVKNIFKEADEALEYPISKIVLEGPKEELNLTSNTQPAIFLVSYSIFRLVKDEFNININDAKYFAGHSLGEYTALACAEALNFSDTIRILKKRGDAMQNSVPKGVGGMMAVLGSKIEIIEKIIKDNRDEYEVYIANDNSLGQIVVSGKIIDLEKFAKNLKLNNIKNILLPVSAPFHCILMQKATEIMKNEIKNLKFKNPQNILISNVTAKEISDIEIIKDLLIKQIEKPVRWRESVLFMINNGVNKFIEIGPGKVLSGLIKRIDKNVEIYTINTEEDIRSIKLND